MKKKLSFLLVAIMAAVTFAWADALIESSGNQGANNTAIIGASYTLDGKFVAGKGGAQQGDMPDMGVKLRSNQGPVVFKVNEGFKITGFKFWGCGNTTTALEIESVSVDGGANLLSASVSLPAKGETTSGIIDLSDIAAEDNITLTFKEGTSAQFVGTWEITYEQTKVIVQEITGVTVNGTAISDDQLTELKSDKVLTIDGSSFNGAGTVAVTLSSGATNVTKSFENTTAVYTFTVAGQEYKIYVRGLAKTYELKGVPVAYSADGAKAEGAETKSVTMNGITFTMTDESKTFQIGNGKVTLGEVAYAPLKLSTGCAVNVTFPEGKKATKVIVYGWSGNGDGKLTAIKESAESDNSVDPSNDIFYATNTAEDLYPSVYEYALDNWESFYFSAMGSASQPFVVMDFVFAGESATKTIYFNPGIWEQDQQEASYAAWAWGDGADGAWYAFDTEKRTFAIPETCAYIIFVRYNPETQFNQLTWNDVWNQTDDITIGNKNMFEITGWKGADGSTYSTYSASNWPPDFYDVNIAEGIQNGSITVQPNRATEGATITVTATPDEGYVLDAITVTCVNIDQAVQVAEDGTFVMPADDVTVNATFKEPTIVSYYVVGTMTKWQIENTFQLLPSKTEEGLYEYYGTFAANDEFKVQGSDNSWYPAGTDNNYVIKEAGEYTISFRPAGNVEGWYEGYFNVVKNGGDDPQPTTDPVVYAIADKDWVVENGALTNGTVSFPGEGASSFKKMTGYFIMGKKDAYINFPKYDFDVEKIVVQGNSGASAATKMNIFVGDNAASTETEGSNDVNTYEIAADYQAAGTQYTLKVTSAHNAQITKIAVYPKGSGGGGDDPQPAEPVFIVVGQPQSIFGGTKAWDTENDAHKLELIQGNYYYTFKNVAPQKQNIQLKVYNMTNGAWFGKTVDGGENIVFNMKETGDFTVALDVNADFTEGYVWVDGDNVVFPETPDPQPTGDSFTIKFKDNGVGNGDGNDAKTEIADLIADGADYVKATAAEKAYNGKEGYGVKLSSSSANGSMTLTLAQSVKPTKITFKASAWVNGKGVADAASISINGKAAQELTDELAEYAVDYDGETEVSEIAIAATKRAYITEVTVVIGGGDTPAVDTYGIVGDLTGGWPDAGGQDAEMKKVVGKDGVYTLVVTDFEAKAGTEYKYKLRANKSWDDYQLPAQGDAIWKPEVDGIYTLTFTANINENKLDLVATKTSINTVAELNKLENNATFKFFGNAIVVAKMAKKNSNYVYIYDETGASLIYDQTGEYTAKLGLGNVITAPWAGTVSIYKGLFEVVPTEALGATSTVEVKYPIKTAEDVTVDNVNQVIELKGLTIAKVDGSNINFTIGNSAIVGYNQFGIELPAETEGKTFDVVGAISRYNDNVQFQPISITEAQPQPLPTVEKLYIIGNGTANEWANTTEVAFNEQTNAFEYEITAKADCYIAFGDAELNNDWNTFNGSHRYALVAGKNVVPVIGEAQQLILTQGEGCVLLAPGYKYALSVTKDLKLTVTREELPAQKFTATFSNTGNWSEVYAYTFSLDEAGQKVEELGAMPGKKLEAGIDGIFQVEIEASVAPQYIVFNNGVEGEGLIKTANLAFVDGKTYDYKPLNTYAATFSNTGNWSEVYAYTFSKNEAGEVIAQELGKWPGTQLSAGTEGLYQVLIEAENAPQFIIFNNGNGGEGNQTDDLAFVDGKAYSYEVEPTPEEKDFTVQFVNLQGFENVHAYTWGNGEPQQGEWPGAAMTLINEQASYGGQNYPIYQLDFKAEAAPEFIAFNNGGFGEGNQTEDLVFENGKRYIVLDMKGKIAATVKEPMQLDYSDKVKIYNGMPQILWGEPKTLPVEFKVGDAIHIRIVDCPGMRSPGLQLMSDDGKVYLTENVAAGIKKVPAIVTIPITGALYEWMKDEQHKVRLCGQNVFIDRMTVEPDVYPAAETPAEEETTISVWVPESEEGDEITKEKTVEIPATSFIVSDVKEEEVVKIKASTVEPNPIIAKRRALAATDISIMKKGSSDVKLVADDAIRVSEDGYEFTVSDEATVTELKTNGFDIKNNTEKPIKIKAVEVKKIPVPKYYLVGTMNGWAIQAQNELTPNNEGEGEYMITLDLAADDEIKVVMSTDESTATTWYPDGMDNNYKITETGNYTIYFRPDGQGGNEWYYGCFYVQLNEGTGICAVKNAAALKGAQIYTINGQRVDKAQKGLYIVNGKKVVVK